MKNLSNSTPPADAAALKAIVCYPVDTLPRPDLGPYFAAHADHTLVERIVVPSREAASFRVPAHDVQSASDRCCGPESRWSAIKARNRGKVLKAYGS